MKIQKYNSVLNGKLVSWNNTTIYVALLSDGYEFDAEHTNLDIIPYQNFSQKLEVSQLTHNMSIIFDAQDVSVERTEIALSRFLLIYDIQKGPLFLYDEVCGLPTDVEGNLNIKFSDNYHKIFSYDILTQEYSFGTPIVSTIKLQAIQEPTELETWQSRSGIPISFIEEVDKSYLTNKNSIYKDLSASGKPHPLTGDLNIVTGVSAINQSLKNIILTDTYERPFSSQNIAANIRKYLFEFNDSITRDAISKEVMTAIQNYEPRILVLGIKIDSFLEAYSVAITIAYKIKTTNIDGTTTIYLKRA